MIEKTPIAHGGRRRARRLGLLVITLLWVGPTGQAAWAGVGVRPDSAPRGTARGHVGSVRDLPGYVPPVDPESASAVTGRRLNAPRVSKDFVGGARSLNDLGRRACRALQDRNWRTLDSLCVRSDEFRDILWREFPQSRPATGIRWQDAWFFVLTRNSRGCSIAVRDLGGRPYAFLSMKADSTLQYRNFRFHTRITLMVRDAANDTLRMDWVRAVVERKGRFKFLSLKD